MIRIGSDEPFYPYTCPRNFFNSEMRDSELKKYPNQKSIIKNNNSWGKRKVHQPNDVQSRLYIVRAGPMC